MVRIGAASPKSGWALRDWFAGATLFLLTAAVVLWQNAHVAVLWDLSYTLDSATRIALGQLPYRDFPFAHAPLTFLIQAAIIRLTGRVFFHHILYAAVIGGLGTVLTWRIVLRTLQERVTHAWTIALILAAPLTVLGIYCILPFPSYDCDCAFSILVAIWLLQGLAATPEIRSTKQSIARGFASGAAICLPVFFKQNIGLPFVAVCLALVLLLLAAPLIFRHRRASVPRAALFAVLAGATTTLALAALLIQGTVGIGNYIHWTIQFAAQRRLPGLHDMLAVYRDPTLLWTLPCAAIALFLLRSPLAKARSAQVAALGLLAAPFLFTLCSLFLYDDADERGDSLLALWPLLLILAAAMALFNLFKLRRQLNLRALLPIILLVAINGTLMSQQLWGSTYAIWPLLILLIAEMIPFLAEPKPPGAASRFLSRNLALALAAVISVTLLICGAFYTASEERLSYAQFPDTPVEHSAFPQLDGISTPGPYLPNFDELLRYVSANILISDGLILLPGEDPFYFVTGRTPQFPVLLFDPATDPYSPAQVVEQARLHQIRWLIVKRDLQIKQDPTPQRGATLNALLPDFTLSVHLHGYDVYMRR
jgi:hypothetical protein